MRPRGSGKELERRRKKAIELLQDGRAPVDVAVMLGVNRRSVRRWNASYRAEGLKGIECRPTPGRPARLNERDKTRLTQILLDGAKASGFPTNLWTSPRVVQMIQAKFGVDYHVDHVGRLLHSMGWSPQKPARKAIERNESLIAGWVAEEWKRIKKKPPG